MCVADCVLCVWAFGSWCVSRCPIFNRVSLCVCCWLCFVCVSIWILVCVKMSQSFGNSLSRCPIFRQVTLSSFVLVCVCVCCWVSGCPILWQQPVKWPSWTECVCVCVLPTVTVHCVCGHSYHPRCCYTVAYCNVFTWFYLCYFRPIISSGWLLLGMGLLCSKFCLVFYCTLPIIRANCSLNFTPLFSPKCLYSHHKRGKVHPTSEGALYLWIDITFLLSSPEELSVAVSEFSV